MVCKTASQPICTFQFSQLIYLSAITPDTLLASELLNLPISRLLLHRQCVLELRDPLVIYGIDFRFLLAEARDAERRRLDILEEDGNENAWFLFDFSAVLDDFYLLVVSALIMYVVDGVAHDVRLSELSDLSRSCFPWMLFG